MRRWRLGDDDLAVTIRQETGLPASRREGAQGGSGSVAEAHIMLGLSAICCGLGFYLMPGWRALADGVRDLTARRKEASRSFG
jgi:hypothetical protein